MRLSSGSKLGPYEIIAPLGAGGMGEVYRARDPRLGREVAIKVLPAEFTSDADRLRRFELEARATGALNHPNILAIHDVGSENGVAYMVAELLEGETLRSRMQSGAAPLRKAIDFAAQAARGLAAAHQKGIVHRDLKPENLFVTSEGRIKILDFGLAKLAAPAGTGPEAPTATVQTDPGAVMGTAGYMAPEQVRGQPVDHRADIFSLGVILYEMVAGRRAFQGDSLVETQHAILKEDPPPVAPSQLAQAPGLEQILWHCLEKNPAERFQSAQDLAFDLEALSGVSGRSKPALAPVRTSRSRHLVLPAIFLAGLVAGAAGVWLALPPAAPDLSAQRFTPLATDMATEIEPAWSPDARTIAYSALVDGVFQIFTKGPEAATAAQITRSETDCRAPQWSPDGSRIYYLASAPDRTTRLAVIGATGGVPELKEPGITAFAVSPDGKTLALVRQRKTDEDPTLWFQPASGGESRAYKEVPSVRRLYYDAQVRFSPDGATLGMWLRIGEGTHEFWTIPFPEGPARRALEGRTVTLSFSPRFGWMPDSRGIVYPGVIPPGVSDHLMLGDIKSGRSRALTAGAAPEAYPAVSPAGDKIAFTVGAVDLDLAEIPLDGGAPRIVLATTRLEHCPSWSAIEGQFCYTRDFGRRQEIWLHNTADRSERPFITPEVFRNATTGRVSECAISPDGRRVAFLRVGEGGQYSVWLSTVAGGSPVRLTDDSEITISPVWSPDGNWIAYLYGQMGRLGLAKANSGGGGRGVKIKDPGAPVMYRPKWSPRGDWITWLDQDGMWLVSPDGGKSLLLSKETGWQSHGFSKDGSALLGIRRGPRRRFSVVSIDIASKRERILSELGTIAEGFHGFSLAPDGKSFLTSMSRFEGDIWILEGFK